LVAALHLLFDQLDTNYLIPRIIGRRVRLHPLVVILGIVAGAVIGGVLGIALAAPTIASLRVLGRYVYANLIDADPFPGQVSEPLPAPDPHWWQKAPVLRRLNWRVKRNRRPVRRR
jgi:predicted PurR-regulated permease PerM